MFGRDWSDEFWLAYSLEGDAYDPAEGISFPDWPNYRSVLHHDLCNDVEADLRKYAEEDRSLWITRDNVDLEEVQPGPEVLAGHFSTIKDEYADVKEQLDNGVREDFRVFSEMEQDSAFNHDPDFNGVPKYSRRAAQDILYTLESLSGYQELRETGEVSEDVSLAYVLDGLGYGSDKFPLLEDETNDFKIMGVDSPEEIRVKGGKAWGIVTENIRKNIHEHGGDEWCFQVNVVGDSEVEIMVTDYGGGLDEDKTVPEVLEYGNGDGTGKGMALANDVGNELGEFEAWSFADWLVQGIVLERTDS